MIPLTDEGVRRANMMALRLLAWLFVTGGSIAALLSFAISRFDTVVVGASTRLVLPASHGRATVDPATVTVLAACAAVLFAAGFASILLARRGLMLVRRAPDVSRPASRERRARRSGAILAVGLVVLAGVIALRWSRSVQHDEHSRESVTRLP